MGSAANSAPSAETIIDIPEKVDPSLWPECCIYRVPCNLRKVNKEAYTPQLISIGPFHHGEEELQAMEKEKRRYFHFFWERLSNKQALENYKTYLHRKQEKIRLCYADTFREEIKNQFSDIILKDSVFIMELFLRIADSSKHTDDYMVTKAWLTKTVQRDLLLLENQLPIFVLVKLYKIALPQGDEIKQKHPTFLDLAHQYFDSYDRQKNLLDEKQSQHCTDSICGPQKLPSNKFRHDQNWKESIHFTDLIRYFYLPLKLKEGRRKQGDSGPSPTTVRRTATKLQESGVSFDKVLNRGLLDLRFKKKKYLSLCLCLGCFPIPLFKCFKARFRIPQLKVDNNTECVLRNLIAFEQCHYPEQPYICNYVSLIDSLIHTKDDVELLVEKEVIVHELGSDKEVATLVNGLSKHVVTYSTCYKEIIDDLNKHHQNTWNHYMAALRLVYFRDPWRTSSTVVGIAVLVFTIFNFCRVVRVVF